MTHIPFRVIAAAYALLGTAVIAYGFHTLQTVFSDLKQNAPRQTWENLGSPQSLRDVFRGCAPMWREFIRTKGYRRLGNESLSQRVDQARRRVYIAIWLVGALGLILMCVGSLPPYR